MRSNDNPSETMKAKDKTPFSCQRDGLTLRGHVFGEAAPGKPAVIISHGFLATEKTVFDYARALAAEGYVAVTFDFNGGGIGSRSDGKSEDMTLLTEKADLLAVTEAVKARYQPAGISLMGCSQGGFVSALAAKELGCGEITSLVMFYPALCIPDDARKGHMMVYRFDPAHVPDVLGRLPMKLGGNYARVVMDMDPYQAIRGYEGPVLLVHGTDDSLVDISYSRRAKEVYAQCEYHEIQGGGHGFDKKHDEEAISILKRFLASHS